MTETKDKDTTPVDDEFGGDRAPFLPSWDFEKDPILIGTVVTSEVVRNVASRLSGDIRDVELFTIEQDDEAGRVTVWGSGMLARILPAHVGHRVRIESKGVETQQDKQQLRVFDVRCATCTAAGR